MGSQIWEDAPEREGVQPLDRRGSSRTVALFRPGLIETCEFRSFCLIRNISPSGLMAAIHVPLRRGEPATVRFSETDQVAGKVVWQRDDRTGIEFSEEIDVSRLLSRISQNAEGRSRYRSPRLVIRESANFIVRDTTKVLEVRDISQRGLKASVNSVVVDQEGTMVIAGLQPRPAVVRWVQDDMAGFYFIDPIPFSELGQWALFHHEIGRTGAGPSANFST